MDNEEDRQAKNDQLNDEEIDENRTRDELERKKREEEEEEEQKKMLLKKKKKKSTQFPWWFKIIAYILSLFIAGVSLFFIVIKGISLGDQKVAQWLTSLLSSFISSVLLTQPIQVFRQRFFYLI